VSEVAAHGEEGSGLVVWLTRRLEGDTAADVETEPLQQCEVSSGYMDEEDELPPRTSVSEQRVLGADREAPFTSHEASKHPWLGCFT
jgi:hypothetical protein